MQQDERGEGAPVRVIHRGQAALIISTTSNYGRTGAGTGGDAKDKALGIWMPYSTKGYFIVGFYAQANLNDPVGEAWVVNVENDDDRNPLIAPPAGYTAIWNDPGKHGQYNAWTVWLPKAPEGYVSIGCIAIMADEKPETYSGRYRCLRHDLVTPVGPSEVRTLIWTSTNGYSVAKTKVWLYAIPGVPNAFTAQADHSTFTGTVYNLKEL